MKTTTRDSFSFLLCRRIIGTPSSFSVGDITNQQLSASCFDVKLCCWPWPQKKKAVRVPSPHTNCEKKRINMMKRREPDKKWLKKTCALLWSSFSLHLLGHRGRAGGQLPPSPWWNPSSSWENDVTYNKEKRIKCRRCLRTSVSLSGRGLKRSTVRTKKTNIKLASWWTGDVCTRTTFVRDKVRTPSTGGFEISLCFCFSLGYSWQPGNKTKVQLQSPRVRAN